MPTINQFSAVTSLNPSDQLLVFSSSNGDTRKASISTLLDFFGANFVSPEFIETYANPTLSGFVVPVPTSTANQWLILAPTGAFAAGTITLPLSSGLVDGQQVLVTSTQAITALTINGNGATTVGSPTGLGAGGFFSLRYDKLGNRWFTTASRFVDGVLPSITLTSTTGGTIKDVNGAPIVDLDPNYTLPAASTTYIRIRNRNTGADPQIQAAGVDANIGIQLLAKGTGAFTVSTVGSSFSGSGAGSTALFATAAINMTAPAINAANLVIPTRTLALLNAAALAAGNPPGMRGSCSDSAIAASTGNFSSTFAGGGANFVPCWFDGSVWRIG